MESHGNSLTEDKNNMINQLCADSKLSSTKLHLKQLLKLVMKMR